MRKIFLCLFSLILLSGCSPKELKDTYEKMQKDESTMTNYNADLRIYGTFDDVRVNEIIKITKYNNDYEIFIKEISNDHEKDEENESDLINRESKATLYIKDNKTYVIGDSGKYKESSDSYYNNPDLYLLGLNNIKKVKYEREETIGINTYKVHEVVFDKKIVNKILEDMPFEYKTQEDCDGNIYIDSNGFVYRIIYLLDKLTININYYGINGVREIDFPNELK